MLSASLLSSSLFLLQAIVPVVLGAALPDDNYYDPYDHLPPPVVEPQPPARGCDEAGCRDPTYQLQDDTLIPDKPNVWVITFGRPGKYQEAAKPDINKILSDYLSTSLPYFLNQLSLDKKIVPSLVKEGIPILINAITSITQEKAVADAAKELQKWSQKVEPKSPCGAFAAAAVSASLVAYDAVYFANEADYASDPNDPNGASTTNDLDYFLKPAYGSISHDDDVIIHYNAKFPDYFAASKPSTNVDRNVYVRLSESAAKYRASPSSAPNPDFKKLVRILLKQFGQVKQWAAVDYLDTDFELGYLREYCKAGFRFQDNKYEKEATSSSSAVKTLLDDSIGAQFFDVWTAQNLYDTLGLPTAHSYAKPPRGYTKAAADQAYSLDFEKGKLQIKKAGTCWRTTNGGKNGKWAGKC